jgi:hypothetical protein
VAVCHLQFKENQLVPYARYLTAQQNPRYSTLSRKVFATLSSDSENLPHVLDVDNRIVFIEDFENPYVWD